MTVQTDGIILKSQKYKESDNILTVFTKNYGKLTVFSRFTKKIKSPYLSSTSLFAYANMEISIFNQSASLHSSTLKKNFYKFSENLHKYYLASYIAELIDKTQMENITDTRLFEDLKNTFFFMEKENVNLKLLRLVFELFLLRRLGIMPNFHQCNICKSTDYNILKNIDVENGVVICEQCIKNLNIKTFKMDKNLVRFINFVYSNSLNRNMNVKIAKVFLDTLSNFLKIYFNIHLYNLNLNSYDILINEENLCNY